MTCFQQLYPLDDRCKNIRGGSRESKVVCFLREHEPKFIHNTTIVTYNCNRTHRRRIDHRMLVDNTIIAVETDEHQHKYYNKKDEEIRHDDLYMIFSGKWIFIRFNVDSYSVNGIKKDPPLDSRLKVLLEEIEKHKIRISNDENQGLVEIVKLYFDE